MRLSEPLNPTLAQRFYASQWPEYIWFGGATALTLSACLRSAGFNTESLTESWSSAVWFFVVALLAAPLGICLAAFPGGLIFGPTIHERGRINGAPFRVGDRVQIIGGKFSGRTTVVYSTWQCESVRLKLGEPASEDYSDIYMPTQLLRIDTTTKTPRRLKWSIPPSKNRR